MVKLRELMHRIWVQQFVKYVIGGCIATAVDMAALHLFFRILHVPFKLSVTLGFLSGNITSFLYNKYFTFKNFSSSIVRQYVKYFVTSITGLLWTLLLMTLFYQTWNLFGGVSKYNYLLCKMLVAVLVMFWNFVIIRHWTLAKYDILATGYQKKDYGIFLSVIIPAYNEERRLPSTLNAIITWLEKQDFTYEIIVVDDGSKDKMVGAIESNFIRYPFIKLYSLANNRGKGAAVNTGMLLAEGQYRLFIDADHQIDISELNDFLPLINSDTVLIGSKYIHIKDMEKETSIPPIRVFISRMGNLIIRILLNIDVHDTQCGFKIFPAHIAEDVFRMQKITGFAFDVEILTLAKLLGAEIKEIPVVVHSADESRVRTVRDSISVFIDLLKIKMNIWRKQYKPNPEYDALKTYQVRRVL